MRIRALALSAALLLPTTVAHAQQPGVNYTVSGSSGDWFLNFNAINGFSAGDQYLYFFGVFLSSGSTDVVGLPTGWQTFDSWSNAGLGGSSIPYNHTFYTGDGMKSVAPGSSLDGFVVHSTAVDAPTSVDWFAFTTGSTPYTGSASFNGGTLPGFEGVATPVTATPEPASLALMATGLVGLGGFSFKRRRRGATAAV